VVGDFLIVGQSDSDTLHGSVDAGETCVPWHDGDDAPSSVRRRFRTIAR
jgi:hypothetical protein